MKLVNFHYFYTLSRSLQQLNGLTADTPIIANWQALYGAEMALREFLQNDLLPPEASNESGQNLVRLLDKLTSDATRADNLSAYEIATIQNALRNFEAILEGEYRIKIVFALSKKGLYSLNQLAYHGDEMVPETVHAVMPEISRDLKDAGRCIAFEVPTAAAFHLFRATEAAAKSYILAVRNKPVTRKEQNLGLGGYKKILEKEGIDDRILASLNQLITLHRNPTIHPEKPVSNEEVLATLGMVESVITIMALDIRRRSETPTLSLDEFLPAAEKEEGKDDGIAKL